MTEGAAATGADLDQALARYVEVLEGLGDVAGLDALDPLVDPAVRFTDPFSDVTGRAALKRCFAATFEAADQIRFVVTGRLRQGPLATLLWTMALRPRRLGARTPWTFEGVSVVTFDGRSGQVVGHADYWDAGRQFYGRLPVLGWVIARIRRRLAGGHGPGG